MPLKTVNGLNVYIIDAPTVEQARGSNGVGYAQMLTQLRWKLWENARESVKDQMQYEKLGYEAELDAYVKEKEQLTRALAKTQEIKDKIKSGAVSVSDGLAAARFQYSIDRDTTRRNDRLNQQRVTNREFINPDTGEKETLKSTSGYEQVPGTQAGGSRSAKSYIESGAAAVGYKTPDQRKKEAQAAANSDYESKKSAWNAAFKASGIADPDEFAKSEAGKSVEANLKAASDTLAQIKSQTPEQFVSGDDDIKAEQEFGDYESQLQAKLDALFVPSPSFDTNISSRTREAFGGVVGTGGMFGFAPRRSKISPVYDEARAREAMARSRPLEQEVLSASAAKKYEEKKAALMKAKGSIASVKAADRAFLSITPQELAAQEAAVKASADAWNKAWKASGIKDPKAFATSLGGKDVEAKLAAEQAKLNSFKENKAAVDKEVEALKQPPILDPVEETALRQASEKEALAELAEGYLEVGPGERTQRKFMNKQQYMSEEPEQTEPPKDDPNKVEPPEDDPNKNNPPPPTPTDAELVFGGGILPASPEEPSVLGTDPDVMAPRGKAPTPAREPLPKGRGFAAEIPGIDIDPRRLPPTPAPTPAPTPVSRGPFELDDDNKDINVGDLSPDVSRAAETPEARKKKKEDASKQVFVVYGIKTDANDAEKLKVYDEFIIQGKDKDPAFKINSEGDLVNPAAADWYKTTLDNIRNNKTGKIQPKTREGRSSAYALKIINKGKDLAEKPNKLARLAKTDLPESERMKNVAEHIALVDKLYEINKSKADVYKSTYSEIARVYEKQPKLRDAALEYLVAKDLLYGSIA